MERTEAEKRKDGQAMEKEEDNAQVTYTDEQLAVLRAEGRMIVSASAGSGKTFVMIEKMLRLILAGVDVDRMIALTFTKKAAAQMREKIQKSIIARINAEETTSGERDMLKRQLTRLPTAEISTIHSFCARLIRSHFFLADVDSAFEIIADDDAEGKSLQEQAISQVFFEAYEAGGEGFLRLLSVYYVKKKDDNLKKIIKELYKSLRVRADYRDVLKKAKRGDDALFDEVAGELYRRITAEAKYIADQLQECLADLERMGNQKTIPRVREMLDFLTELQNQKDYFSICVLPMPKFGAKERIQNAERAAEKKVVEKTAFYKDAIEKLCAPHLGSFAGSMEEERARFARTQEITELLAEFILRFDDKYTELKRERARLDYNDLEHIALRLLSDGGVAAETREKFEYVFVDEYQDVNPVQEQIISLISGKNVFLVGDVKQSIYAFRGSKSVYFSQKQAAFEEEENAQSLFLTSNFRSAKGILDCVNTIFCRAMTKERCGIDYAAKPMQGGSGYAGNEGRVRLHLIETGKTPPVERGVYSVLAEYEALSGKNGGNEDAQAREILNIIDEELHSQVYDLEEKKFRPVGYGDIAILSRKKSKDVSALVAYLAENGIPVSTAAEVNICKFAEIRQLTDILSLIDNRAQDIPLCSALLSAMGNVTNAELAAIRLRYERRRQPFRESVRLYSEQFADDLAQKLKKFFALLDKYVTLSHVLYAGELIERLIGETGLETDWLSREGGSRRLARVRTFASLAREKNLHDFLKYLQSLAYDVPVSENAGENAVKVLTMHASKGLEYPVVILADLNDAFHGADRSEVYLSEKYGIAPRCFDREKKRVYSTPLRKLIVMEEREEELKNELNLLYVAMTRAKYSLHLVAESKDAAAYTDLYYCRSFAQLLPPDCFDGQIAPPYAAVLPFEKRQPIVADGDKALTEEIKRSFSAPYRFQENVDLPVKSSASELLEQEAEYYAPHRLLGTEEEVPAEKTVVGTAYHAFLEHADFSGDGADELRRMKEQGVLPEEQLVLLSPEKTQKILGMPVFGRLQSAQVYREQPFLVMLPAREMLPTDAEEEVLFQGFIDLLAVTESGVEIVDYKYSSRPAEEIRKHYALQIQLYKKAAAKILQIEEKTIRATIVNIQKCEELPM